MEVQKHMFALLQFTIYSEHKMFFKESVIYTLILFTTAESLSRKSMKETIQSEPLKAKCCGLCHSYMAETWAVMF